MPMLAQCACWESSESIGTEFKTPGTARHAALGHVLSGDPDPLAGLSEEDAASVQWAADYIAVKAPTSEHALRMEYRVNPLAEDFSPIFENGGTLDVACGPHLFDLKTRERDYTAQMAAYSLDMFQEFGWPEIEVHLLFAETKRATTFKLTEEAARGIVEPIIRAAASADKKPTPCDYCGWCVRRLTCPALLERVNALVVGREDWKLEQWHTSRIDTAEQMGKALRLARQIADWCESVEFHAKDMALKRGMVAAGFKLQTRSGNRYVTSVAAAFPLCGLPQAEFLAVCDVKPTSLFEAYASFHGLKKAAAERDLEQKLGEIIQRKFSAQSLVVDKTTK